MNPIRITVGSITMAALIVAAGIGLLPSPEDVDQQSIVFDSMADYEVSRDPLLLKWENNDPIDIVSEYPLLISILSHELNLVGGWEFDTETPIKTQILEKARIKRNENGQVIVPIVL